MPSRNSERGDQSPPGDFTAREKARLEAEQDTEQREAAERMALATKQRDEVNEKGIFDGETGQMLEGPELIDDDEDEGDDPLSEDDVEEAQPEEAPVKAAQKQRARREAAAARANSAVVADTQEAGGMTVALLEDEEEIQDEYRIGRVNTDLPSVTFGHGNTFNFERGRRYRMPKDLYEHLDNRGYIHH